MQLHRILFVFLGNLLKPLSRLIHLLCNEPAPPRALSHSSKQQGQLPSPAGLPADSLQRAERAVASSQPYFGYRLGPKSTCVSWGEARQTAAWGGRAEKTLSGTSTEPQTQPFSTAADILPRCLQVQKAGDYPLTYL